MVRPYLLPSPSTVTAVSLPLGRTGSDGVEDIPGQYVSHSPRGFAGSCENGAILANNVQDLQTSNRTMKARCQGRNSFSYPLN